MVIVFTKDADPVSDYDIEEFYNMFKKVKEIHICNSLLLMRFRVGVARGEIENFTIRVEQEDGSYLDIVNNPQYANSSRVLGLMDEYLDKLLNL